MKYRKIIFIIVEIIFGMCVFWFTYAYTNNIVDNLKSNIDNSHELVILLRKLPIQMVKIFSGGVLSTLILIQLNKMSKPICKDIE